MALLDRKKTYKTRTIDESYWEFIYGTRRGKPGEKGTTGWWAFRRRPGEVSDFCFGVMAEAEVWERMKRDGHPLTEDDNIDLHVWLNHGGLEQMMKEGLEGLEELEEVHLYSMEELDESNERVTTTS